jgi:hypothetical protein
MFQLILVYERGGGSIPDYLYKSLIFCLYYLPIGFLEEEYYMKKNNKKDTKRLPKESTKLLGEILSSVQKSSSGKVVKVRFGK